MLDARRFHICIIMSLVHCLQMEEIYLLEMRGPCMAPFSLGQVSDVPRYLLS